MFVNGGPLHLYTKRRISNLWDVGCLSERVVLSFFPGSFAPRPRKPNDGSNGNSEGENSGGGGGSRPVGNPFRNPLFITLLVLILIGAIIFFLSQTWTEVLWFKQVQAERVIWTQWLSAVVLWIIAFAIMFASLAGWTQWAYRRRPLVMPGGAQNPLRVYQQAIKPALKFLLWGVPAIIAFVTALTVASEWRTVLVWLNHKPFGSTDPQFGIDISFYVFTLPVIQLLVGYLMMTSILSLIGVSAVNYLYGGMAFTPRPRVTPAARKQIGFLAAIISLLIGVRYLLNIYTMMYQTSDLVDGALFRDVHAEIPAQVILAVISLLVAVLFVITAFKGTWLLPVTAVAVTIVSALVIGGIYPALIQQFRVTPNARQLEQPYIQRNIDATLKAYGLDDVEYQQYAAKTDATAGQLREDSESTSQIRLMDPMIVPPTFKQLQQSRPYYTFDQQLSVDRYTIGDERRDTVIGVRDLNLAGLQDQQQTWVNLHTVYTHGFGVVAAYGNTARSDGTPAFWEQSIPSVGDMGDYEERVYFSQNAPSYSIVGAEEGAAPQELDYPDDNAPSGQVQTTFTGNGGPSIGNVWNKLLYAVKFGSTDIFFSSQTNTESQILYTRDPLERVQKVAPFLTLEQKAYPAVVDMDGDDSTPKRLVWIVDGYTTTDNYPYSEHQSLSSATTDSRTLDEDGMFLVDSVNYIRNSVKAVVDAYDGSVTLYQWDKEDPILASWDSVYPGLLQDTSSISGDLMSHLRYPEDMFKVQRSLLQTYHVTEAAEFYTGGDRWRLSEDPTASDESGTSQKLQAPYYLTMQMPTQDSAEFSLTSVYVPAGTGESRRAAMAGFLAVDSETGSEPGKVRKDYGKLRLLALPSSTTVPGPGQVQNAFNSDGAIARELNLLSQQGSNVTRGNLLTLPVGGGLLYVQPVYVKSTGSTSYPVLRYVLTAFGDQIGFGNTLAESLDQTFGGDAQATVTDIEGGGSEDTPSTETEKSPEEQLNQALLDAEAAMNAAEQALQTSDWAAYGMAQDKLAQAVEKALSLQNIKTDSAGGAQSGDAGIPAGDDTSLGDLGQDAAVDAPAPTG